MSGDLFDSVGSGDEANREIRFGNGGDRTDVLLVDDDTQWARLMASDIEAASDDIEVTVAGSATEAMETFREQGQFDCLVADYQMPGADGIQLLERVRERRPQFPFLLVTSQGSEQVAERAIDAGVTDYLIKDFGADQATKFLSRIQTAVDHYRLQCALAESEERYRTVTEQSRDATATIQGGQLLFCNQRLVELTGRQRDHLRNSSDIVAEIVHEDDREQVRSVVDAWDETPDEARLHEARVVRPDGTVRHCEYTGGRIDHDGERATLVSIRDVTERQRRERELQWERELNRTIQRTLVESRSRDSLERSVTEQLQRHGYTLAWIGERIGDELVPRVVEGDRQYVDAIDRTIEASPTDGTVEGRSTDGTVEGRSTD
ncbi:MAG: response regulator, partial [Halobaculum sp.]